MITENLDTLKINKLTQEQYNNALAAGKINENEIYLTPDEDIIIDQAYNANSENAQSGIAVAEAIANSGYLPKTTYDNSTFTMNLEGSMGGEMETYISDSVKVNAKYVSLNHEDPWETHNSFNINIGDKKVCIENGNGESSSLSATDLQIDDGVGKIDINSYCISMSQDATTSLMICQDRVYGSDTMKQAWKEFLDINSNKPTIDPIFANNSWETIAWVAKNDDPSKYWKVGDYKEIPVRKIYFEYNEGFEFINAAEIIRQNEARTGERIENQRFVYWYDGNDYAMGGAEPEDNLSPLPLWQGTGEGTFAVSTVNIPVQIIGFNHDIVSDKTAYGKGKSGLTLMLGCNREIYGASKVGVYNSHISYLSTFEEQEWWYNDEGKTYTGYIKSPNGLGVELEDGNGYNWTNGEFRYYLADHLDWALPEELTKHLVTVNKVNSCRFNAKNYWRDTHITSDKYFLLSEYEMYGEQINTKASEGEQYELYKSGYEKIITTPEILQAYDNAVSDWTNSRLWLRSVASKYVDPYIPSTDFHNPLKGYTANPDYKGETSAYTNSLVMSYQGDTGKSNYFTGPASSTSVPAYIAPCFCI